LNQERGAKLPLNPSATRGKFRAPHSSALTTPISTETLPEPQPTAQRQDTEGAILYMSTRVIRRGKQGENQRQGPRTKPRPRGKPQAFRNASSADKSLIPETSQAIPDLRIPTSPDGGLPYNLPVFSHRTTTSASTGALNNTP